MIIMRDNSDYYETIVNFLRDISDHYGRQ